MVSILVLPMACVWLGAAPAHNPAVDCAQGDFACQRAAFQRLKDGTLPGCDENGDSTEGRTVKGERALDCTGSKSAQQEKASAPGGLAWWATAPAQWCGVLGLDLLPALMFGVTAVVFVLPASSVVALLLLAVSCGVIPGLPCAEGILTNWVGDLMSLGTQRGKLLMQMATSVGLLTVQLATGVVGLLLTGAVVNVLVVKQVVPQARYVPAACHGGASSGCWDSLQKVSASSVGATLVAAGGVLGIVAVNLALAVVLKGPALAAAWQLHAGEPPAPPWPRFLPRFAQKAETAPRATPVARAETFHP